MRKQEQRHLKGTLGQSGHYNRMQHCLCASLPAKKHFLPMRGEEKVICEQDLTGNGTSIVQTSHHRFQGQAIIPKESNLTGNPVGGWGITDHCIIHVDKA